MKLVNLQKSPYLRLLVYGDTGAGKTYLAGTAMECEATRPVLVLSARGQPVTLRYFDPPPLVLDIGSMKDFNEPYSWLLRGQPDTERERHTPFVDAAQAYLEKFEFGRFNTIVVDSITHTQRISLDGATGSMTTMPGDMPKTAQIQDWGGTLRQMVNLTNLYFKLPVHVIMTALTKWVVLENMGVPMFGPYLWGQSAMEVPSHAEIVGRLVSLESLPQQKLTQLTAVLPDETRGAYNVLQLRGGRNFVAKWQGVLQPPDFILGPTIGKLIDVLNK